MYYVYCHIRKDTGKAFYIGVGKVSSLESRIQLFNGKYERAFQKKSRNYQWWKIVEKSQYLVVVLCDCETQQEAFDIEVELINVFGKTIDNSGQLSNISNGGLDFSNSKRRVIPILQKTFGGDTVAEWAQPSHIEKQKGYLRTNIVKCCRGKQITAYGFKWEYKNNPFLGLPSASRKKKKA